MTAINILHISLSEQWVLHAYDVPEIYVGEHNATQIIIHPDVVMESTAYTLDFLDASGHDFYKVLAVSNGSLSCMVTQADLACAGTLTAQIVATKSDQTIKRSNKIRFKAHGSILSSNAAPTTQVTAFTEAVAQYASDLQIAKTQRVGYVEYVGSVMSFYTDSTKATRLAQFTIQSGGSSYDDTAIRNRLTAIEQQESTWNAKANTSDIPSALSDLTDDATHRTVTDTEKATWNAKSTFSGSYNDLTNKPTIPTDDHISEIATQAIPSADITANTEARHTHANKTVIDGISAEDIERWNEGGGSGGSSDYELIANVSITEAVNAVVIELSKPSNDFIIVIRQTVNGQPAFVTTGSTTSVGSYTYMSVNDITAKYEICAKSTTNTTQATNTRNLASFVRVNVLGQNICANCSGVTLLGNGYGTTTGHRFGRLPSAVDEVTKITLTADSSASFNAGISVEIYGK